MSQFAILLVTDEKTVEGACRGWVRPAEKPVTKTMTNPFTREPVLVTSYVPPDFDDDVDCATLIEVYNDLKRAKPVCIDFQLSSLLRADFADGNTPFLIGNDEIGVVRIDRISRDKEAKVVKHFANELGPYASEEARRSQDLSMFLLVYDF
jgi:hypothetical protein